MEYATDRKSDAPYLAELPHKRFAPLTFEQRPTLFYYVTIKADDLPFACEGV